MSNEAKASKPYVRRAITADATELAPNLRQDDLDEIAVGSGWEPEEALVNALMVSAQSWAIIHEGAVVALFGVAGLPGGGGTPWMMASEGLVRISKSLLRESRLWVRIMLVRYGSLQNLVWAGNSKHIEWLRWLGFHIAEDPTFIERNGRNVPFFHFHLKDNHV